MGSAWKLSDGYKLWVFLLLIVLGLIGGGIYYAAKFILSNFEVLGDDTSTNTVSFSMVQKMLNGVLIGLPSFFVLGFFAAGMTAAYVELKTLKGHVALAQDVFD